MRTLVYGMQSSGASLFAFFLSQKSECVGIIDLWDGVVAPRLEDTEADVVLKCVVTSEVPLDAHLASFRPDRKILFVREKESNTDSLSHKRYRDHGGKMSEKFSRLERYLDQPEIFDCVVRFEDFLHDSAKVLDILDGLAEPSFYDFARSKHEMLNFNRSHSAWCRQYYRRRWDFGNIHFDRGGRVRLHSGGQARFGSRLLERLSRLRFSALS